MNQSRLFAAGMAAVLAFGGQSLLGRAGQPGAPPAAAGPFDNLHWRQIGPASMSGRISDLAIYEPNSNIWYVATAHGGIWKTVNNGTTFEAQFQDQGLMSIGDIAVSQNNPDLVYVGTGESNNRQSTSWGDGMYKSTDGGKTYTNIGLKSSKHINRVVIDPRDNDVVWVAATGPLFGPGGERGIYKTTDGGKTWKQTLKVDDDTGANDLLIDPAHDKVLYASSYQRRRTSCCMNGGGAGSGIWKSTDAGETWTRLKTGLPEGSLGRIGLDLFRKRPNVLYASIEGPAAGRGGGRQGAGAAAGGAPAGRGAGAAGGAAPATSEEAPAPQAFGGGRGPATGVDASATGLYRSDDGGSTWRKVNNVNARPMYFSQVRVDPNDPDVVYMGGVGLHQSLDGGKSVATDVAEPIHDDVHAIWIDPANSNHVIIGNDGGLAQSWDQAKTWVFIPNLPVGALLPRQRRLGDAVQHLRRHAGQLRLVRTEPGARRRRHRQPPLDDDPGGRRLRGPAGSQGSAGHLQRVAGRQHGPRRPRDQRVDQHPAPGAAGRARLSLALGHADRALAARFLGRLRRGQPRLPRRRQGAHLRADQPRSHHR